ncbi:SigE family RNA polymerase sigma factor [Couchioplanes caeruleus]|uniref:RNA polymerase sigma-70 factor (Sigma-E family) n=1 Tax=Couchioplanes caeruleus TaxID=56438 RepID=A0A3N1GM72_9ACTN|nr:SigE family RNA polymerase sigma factor [Couchioplanes caeruleus]ROP31299.1 RNA polymerase sigma-70 factor (sigma-E family) [Couchioplanes caeruleus]
MSSDPNEVEFEVFARVIRRWLRRQAYDICGDWHEADDLVQVALLKIHQRWDRLHRRAELGAYAHRVVLRSFLTERRRAYWSREVALPGMTDVMPAPDRNTAVEDRARLLPALRRLGARQRAVVTLRFLGDLSVEQTAQVLGCTPGTVTSQTVRAIEALRRDLGSRAPPRATQRIGSRADLCSRFCCRVETRPKPTRKPPSTGAGS